MSKSQILDNVNRWRMAKGKAPVNSGEACKTMGLHGAARVKVQNKVWHETYKRNMPL